MTEDLLAKVENKIQLLLLEAEAMRTQIHQLHHENAQLKNDHVEKLQSLIKLLETANITI